MQREKVVRLLRIAWSVWWGILCLLLIALWVRSFGTWDRCFRTGKNHGMQLNSMVGHVVLIVAERPKEYIPFFIAHVPTEDRFETKFDKNFLGFNFEYRPGRLLLDVPFWFVVLISVAMAATPWARHLSWRFSLRTFLIAITLVAVVLGLVVWGMK